MLNREIKVGDTIQDLWGEEFKLAKPIDNDGFVYVEFEGGVDCRPVCDFGEIK